MKDLEITTNGVETGMGMDDASTQSGIGGKIAIGGLIGVGIVTAGVVIGNTVKWLWGKITHRKADEDNGQTSGDEPECEAEIIDESK